MITIAATPPNKLFYFPDLRLSNAAALRYDTAR